MSELIEPRALPITKEELTALPMKTPRDVRGEWVALLNLWLESERQHVKDIVYIIGREAGRKAGRRKANAKRKPS